jgi:hypothetical protein
LECVVGGGTCGWVLGGEWGAGLGPWVLVGKTQGGALG